MMHVHKALLQSRNRAFIFCNIGFAENNPWRGIITNLALN